MFASMMAGLIYIFTYAFATKAVSIIEIHYRFKY